MKRGGGFSKDPPPLCASVRRAGAGGMDR